jgi:predicted acetyltransferase
MDQVNIRRFALSDLHKLQRFHEECFGRPLDLDRYKWFNLDGPEGPVRSYLAQDAQQESILGTYGLLPIRLHFNQQTIQASLAVNAAVHPAFRKQGLFVELGRHALKEETQFGASVSLGKPNHSALPGHQKVGWHLLCRLPKLVKRSPEPKTHGCLQVASFDERFDDFQQAICERYTFMVAKNAGWMNWRLANPGQSYTRYICLRQRAMSGYVVLKHYHGPKGHVTHLLDLLALDDQSLQELVAAAENFAVGTGEFNVWSNANDPLRTKLLALGFNEQQSPDSLIFHDNSQDASIGLPKSGSWHFCYADNDIH